MVFELSEEQRDFQKTIRRFFENECDSATVRRFSTGFSVEEAARFERSFEALGLSAVFSDAGSARDALAELVLFAGECGRALVPLHFLECVVAGPLFSALVLDDSSRAEIKRVFGDQAYASMASGSARTVRAPFFYQAQQVLSVERREGRVQVSGALRLVPATDGGFIVYQAHDVLLLIKLDTCAERTEEQALDITQRREKIVFKNAEAVAVTSDDAAWYRALTCILVAAEISGACRRVLEMTNDYVKTRQQFGVVVGSFQAVQHALSDMFLKVEMIDSLVTFSSWMLMRSDSQRELSAQAALRLALRDGAGIVEKAIQLHGGIGFTWEHDLHLYLRRVRSISALATDTGHLDQHLLTAARNQGRVEGAC